MDAPRYATTARHWAYPWGMGASLGAGFVGLYYLAYYFWGWPWDVRAAGALWFAFVGVYPFLHDGAGPIGLFIGGVARGFLSTDDDRPEDVEPGPGESARSVSPLVGGGLLSAWEQYHYDGLLTLLEHAEAADSLTSTALIPAAFVDGKHWGYWTGILAASHICHKANGVETKLPQGRTFAWAKRQIKNGDFEAPEDLGAAPPAPPHPYREGLDYHVKPERAKADKAGQKVERDEDD